jgi:hypothetical protein
LQQGGSVLGVFLKLDPKAVEESIKNLEDHEGHNKKVEEDLPGFPGTTYFWPMGNNLNDKLGIDNLEGRDLYHLLATLANGIVEKGPDGYTAKEYALKVREFDPQDAITNMYTEELTGREQNQSDQIAEDRL